MDGNLEKLLSELSQPVLPPARNFRGEEAVEMFNEAMQRGELTYHGACPANISVKKEQPEHTVAIYMFAAGAKEADVAAKLGFHINYVRQLKRQPWFRSKLDRVIEETGRDQVEAFFKSEVIPSLEVLRDIRDDKTIRPASRVAAANSILDRGLGKATVRIETKQLPASPTDATNEVERLRKESEELARQLAANGVTTSSS